MPFKLQGGYADKLLKAMAARMQIGDKAKHKAGKMTESNDAVAGRTRKRQAVKAAGEQATKKLKTTFHLSREADQRLNIHCAMMGVDRSALVERLINENLKRYVVSDRGKPASDEEATA